MLTRLKALPITATGWVTFGIGIVSLIFGLVFGWLELSVLAIGGLLALVVAVPFVIGTTEYEIDREVTPIRVPRGGAARASLTVKNTARTPKARRFIQESINGVASPIRVPTLGAGEQWSTGYALPTANRGVFSVGPAYVAKSDPMGLLRREVGHSNADSFWVHPRSVLLPVLPAGWAKDLEGPTYDTSPAGDVAFHALREYQLGDDFRHVHWLSTARTGNLMVRHYVDNRYPSIGIIVDNETDQYPGGDPFEAALDICASLAISSLAQSRPVAIMVGNEPIIGAQRPGTRVTALDRLAETSVAETNDLALAVESMVRLEREISVVIVVTGPRTATELLPLVQRARKDARVVVVRVWPDQDQMTKGAVPGAKVIDVVGLDGFCVRWKSSL